MARTRAEEFRLIAKVAYMYHQLNIKQKVIADQLDISQATVSRLLRQAQKEGIVRITVTMPTGVYADMENELCAVYGLKAAIIVDCEDPDDETSIQHHIGSAAAYYVETTIEKNEQVGLSSWSSSLLAMVNAMQPLAKSTNAQVVQVLGGVGNPSAEIYASRITERFANLVHGTAIFLPAPGVVSSVAMREALQEDQFVQQAVRLFDDVSLALVGIGSVEPSKLLASSGNVFAPEELQLISEAGAVGDVCLRFFDAEGQPVRTSYDERVISISLDQLKKAKRSVGIAGGRRKVQAIRGAMRGKLINVLITDHFTAKQLLEK
ncbi:MAG: sugar-binding transcriptional regulator [Anaerolineae bacterium]|nr:sugar-binding transcriptional regulator [Anaerolineae bacterium]